MRVTADTGEMASWADTFEKLGAEIGERLVKRTKHHLEHHRRDRRVRFRRIRRLKSGKRRFVAKKPPIEKAEVPSKSFQAHFNDIFDEG